ncbi:MAG: glycosyltransferase family 39 protein [Candidatus Shapirobacteria bacterium]
MDQGLFMTRAREIWNNKELTLIGPSASPMVDGRHFFQGPAIYYLLVGLGLLGNWDVINISWLMVILGWIGMWFLFKTIMILANEKAAWLGALLYCFLPITIEFSNFIWNPNFLLFLMPIFMYFMVRVENGKWWWTMMAGLMAGLCLQFHFQFVPILGLSTIYVFYKNKKTVWIFLLGILLGYLPLIIFDIRNNFYNLRTIFLWLMVGDKKRGILTHDYLTYIPLLLLIWSVKIKSKVNIFILIGIVIWSTIGIINQKQSAWMPDNWTYKDLVKTKAIISQKPRGKINVVNLLNGDSRFYSLRYLLEIDNINLGTVENYKEIEELMVIDKNENQNNIENSSLWEIKQFGGKVVESLPINNETSLYIMKK